MPDNSFNKTASVNAESFDDLVKIIKQHNIKGSAEDIAHDIINNGSGSFLLDGVGAVVKKVPKGEHVINGFKKMQHALNDVDIKAGKKIHDSLANGNGLNQAISKTFVYNHKIPLKPSANGHPDKSIEVGVPMLSAPISKAVETAVPLAGRAYIAGKIMGSGDKEKEGGDRMKAANVREQLIEKIANHVTGQESPEVASNNDDGKASILLKTASEMLKFAADDRKQMLSDMERLAFELKASQEECKKLRSQLVEKTKKEQATKLAKEMNEKGMIKKAEVDTKATEIMALDDDAFNLLKQATENVHIKNEKNGVDNLTFLSEDYNIKSRKKTLADAIDEDM